jgi:hypothetical protein
VPPLQKDASWNVSSMLSQTEGASFKQPPTDAENIRCDCSDGTYVVIGVLVAFAKLR